MKIDLDTELTIVAAAENLESVFRPTSFVPCIHSISEGNLCLNGKDCDCGECDHCRGEITKPAQSCKFHFWGMCSIGQVLREIRIEPSDPEIVASA